HAVCRCGVACGFDVVAWESVQQAYTVGRPLLDQLRDEYFVPHGYRIAHLFLNAASFGNAQRRKRYFFVAYRDHLRFNVTPPTLPRRQATVRDVIEQLERRRAWECNYHAKDAKYDGDAYARVPPWDREVIPHLRPDEIGR